jgi:hypothetical protein
MLSVGWRWTVVDLWSAPAGRWVLRSEAQDHDRRDQTVGPQRSCKALDQGWRISLGLPKPSPGWPSMNTAT